VAIFPVTLPGLLALALVVGGLAAAVWRRYPMAYTMALLSIGVFVIQLGSGAMVRCRIEDIGFRSDCVVADLSFIAPFLFEGQRLLTPFTYMFVHADLFHLAGNLFILLTAGPALEERIGSRNFVLIYLAAGLGAAAATVGLWQVGWFEPRAAGLVLPGQEGGGEFSPNVGASGAIFGVLTAFAVLYPREKLPMILPMMFFVFWMPAVTVLLLHLAINVVYLFGYTNVAWWGHFGGFFVGLALAPLLQRHLPARKVAEALQVDTEALRPVARSHMERSALRELERLRTPQTKDDRLLAEAWWEKFLHSAHCPTCGRKLEQKGKDLACPHGDFAVQALR
jgi:membrane associated rhomboid family serine protease